MFCTKCGQEINKENNFCSNCGNKINKKENNIVTNDVIKTFKSGIFFSSYNKLLQEVNYYLVDKNFTYVKSNLAIYQGVVKSITLYCKEIQEISDYCFQLDIINLGFMGENNLEEKLNKWKLEHPNSKIVNKIIVNHYGSPKDVFILYKFPNN